MSLNLEKKGDSLEGIGIDIHTRLASSLALELLHFIIFSAYLLLAFYVNVLNTYKNHKPLLTFRFSPIFHFSKFFALCYM